MNKNNRNSKKSAASFTIKNELVLPNDTNTLHNLMGGRLLHFMDICAAISAQRHSNRIVVTASVDNVSFSCPIRLGQVVILEAQVTRAFNSSMEVNIQVWAEDIARHERVKCNEAFYTFVAVDQSGNPITVAELEPEGERELMMYESALRRRQMRLVLAGRMAPGDANELKSIFL